MASPAKIERIGSYGANVVVTVERYADALAASEAWAVESGALPVHAYEQVETLLGQGTNSSGSAPISTRCSWPWVAAV